MNETATNNNTRDIIIYEEKSKKNYDSYEIFTKSGVQRIQFKLNGKPYMKKKIERKGFTITKEEIDYDRIEFSLAIQSDKRPFLEIIRIFKFHPLVKCFLEKTNQSRNILKERGGNQYKHVLFCRVHCLSNPLTVLNLQP